MKVVLGIDVGAGSDAALEYVCGATWPPRTQVVVVSVVAFPAAMLTVTVPVTGIEPGPWLRESLRIHSAWAESACERLRAAGLESWGRVPQGDPREQLLEAALAEGADLIVLGAHGFSPVPRLRLGSVVSHLVAHAPCGVLVVRHRANHH